jgi:CheY-like chemotaxis protein
LFLLVKSLVLLGRAIQYRCVYDGATAEGLSRSTSRRVVMKKVRVLIADEHPPLLHHLSALLSDDFCVVGSVNDGRALVTAALELQPQVIISDIDMPIMSGLEAVRRVKALAPAIKVIFLTNHKEQECVAEAFSAGASAFLSKVGRRNLRGRLRAVIRDLHTAPLERYSGHSLIRRDDWVPHEKGVA